VDDEDRDRRNDDDGQQHHQHGGVQVSLLVGHGLESRGRRARRGAWAERRHDGTALQSLYRGRFRRPEWLGVVIRGRRTRQNHERLRGSLDDDPTTRSFSTGTIMTVSTKAGLSCR
jgi:hypothetical protein